MYSTIQPYDVIQAVLQQEVILYCGRLISTNPDLFRGILKIRIGWVLEAMKLYLRIKGSPKSLEEYSPYEVRQLLYKVLSINEWAHKEQYVNSLKIDSYNRYNGFRLTPLQKRQIEGCLCRVPSYFYNKVWDVMLRTPEGIKVMGNVIPQQPTMSNMTRSEITFALLVEQVCNTLSFIFMRAIHVPCNQFHYIYGVSPAGMLSSATFYYI